MNIEEVSGGVEGSCGSDISRVMNLITRQTRQRWPKSPSCLASEIGEGLIGLVAGRDDAGAHGGPHPRNPPS